MNKKLFMAIMFSLFAIILAFCIEPANAAYKTKITLIINNGAPEESINVSRDLTARSLPPLQAGDEWRDIIQLYRRDYGK